MKIEKGDYENDKTMCSDICHVSMYLCRDMAGLEMTARHPGTE